MLNLILVGGGGHCKSIINVAEQAGYNIIGVLDIPQNVGKRVLDYSVIGTDEDIVKYVNKAFFLVSVGQIKDATLRIMLHKRIEYSGGSFATIISPTAIVSRYSEIGKGSVIMHHSIVNSDTKIGNGCIVNTKANIEHDVIVGDFCHISTGVTINGNCIINTETFIGSQSVVSNGISITDRCVIGAGSVVKNDINTSGIYSGNPACLITVL